MCLAQGHNTVTLYTQSMDGDETQTSFLASSPAGYVSMVVFKAFCICQMLFVCFVALSPKSTAMVIAGRSVHLITLFPGQA